MAFSENIHENFTYNGVYETEVSMNTLEEARKEIDAVDQELVQLFERRFLAVKDVIAWKIENGKEILDTSREEAIVAKNKSRLAHPELTAYFEEWYRNMLAVSRKFQQDIKDSL